MKRLIRYFFDLCLLRALPQDLPVAPILLWLILPLNLAVGVAFIGIGLGGVDRGLLAALLDIALSLLWVWLLLLFKDHTGRFLQAATALLGSGALVGLVALPLQVLLAGNAGDPAGVQAGLTATLLLFVLFWSLIVEAHILRHTLEVGMGLAFALAVTYSVLISVIVRYLFPENSN